MSLNVHNMNMMLMRRGFSVKTANTAAAATTVFPQSSKAPLALLPPSERAGNVGRSVHNDTFVTVFGSTGFLGKYVVNQLGRMGSVIHAGTRGDDDSVRKLKPLASYGRLVIRYCHLDDEESIYRAMEHSNVVINLIGKRYDTKHIPPKINCTIEKANTTSAEIIARAARRTGIRHLVHVSSLLAQPNSGSRYGKSKYAGEEAVLREFPGAVIARAGTIYGEEDNFLNLYASLAVSLPAVPIVNGGKAVIRPVFVGDIATAIASLAVGDGCLSAAGEIFELPGPDAFTQKEIVEYILASIGKNSPIVDVDAGLGKTIGSILNRFPSPLITQDSVQTMIENEILTPTRNGQPVRSWESLPEMKLKKFNLKASQYLIRYQQGGHFEDLRKEEEEGKLKPHRLNRAF